MKTVQSLLAHRSLTFIRCAAFALLLSSLPTACKKNDDASPQATCKLTSSTYQGSGSPSITTQEYMADGQLKTSTSSGGSKTNYTYDSNGYLTTVTNLSSNGSVSSTSQVEFTSGRVTKITNKNASGTITSTSLCEYDAAGNLTKYVEQYAGSSTYTATYSGGKQTGYLIRSSTGSESQPYTFENGLVKRYVSGTYQYNYEYDAQGRRTRSEENNSGKLTYYSVYEYTDGTSADKARASFKGIADLLIDEPNQTGSGVGLQTKATGYIISATSVTSKYSETITSYAKNASGFPTEANVVTRYYNTTGAVTSTSAYKYTYVYTGCQ